MFETIIPFSLVLECKLHWLKTVLEIFGLMHRKFFVLILWIVIREYRLIFLQPDDLKQNVYNKCLHAIRVFIHLYRYEYLLTQYDSHFMDPINMNVNTPASGEPMKFFSYCVRCRRIPNIRCAFLWFVQNIRKFEIRMNFNRSSRATMVSNNLLQRNTTTNTTSLSLVAVSR